MISRNENKQIILEEIHYNVETGTDFRLLKCCYLRYKSLFVLPKFKAGLFTDYMIWNWWNTNLCGEQAINSWNMDEYLLNFYTVYQAGVAKVQYDNSILI